MNDGPQEVGPRFELRLFQIKLGTMDMNDAENEYVLRPYMNTAKKRKML
jgi:U3 small nucleolar ribonucleoprotein protein IMP4